MVRSARARLSRGAALRLRGDPRQVRRDEHRRRRRAWRDHRGDRRRRRRGSRLARSRRRRADGSALRLRRRSGHAAVAPGAAGLARSLDPGNPEGARAARLRHRGAGIRRRHRLAARRQRRLSPRGLCESRPLRPLPRTQGGNATQPGAARMAPARACRRLPRLLRAGHARAALRRGGAPGEAVFPALALLARHQPRAPLLSPRVRSRGAGGRALRPPAAVLLRGAAPPGLRSTDVPAQLHLAAASRTVRARVRI